MKKKHQNSVFLITSTVEKWHRIQKSMSIYTESGRREAGKVVTVDVDGRKVSVMSKWRAFSKRSGVWDLCLRDR